MVPMGIEQEIHLYTFFYVLLSLIIVKVFNTLALQTKPSKTNGKNLVVFFTFSFLFEYHFFVNINFVGLRKQLTFGDTTTDI